MRNNTAAITVHSVNFILRGSLFQQVSCFGCLFGSYSKALGFSNFPHSFGRYSIRLVGSAIFLIHLVDIL